MVATNGNIEFPLGIDSEEAIEASSVEVEKPCSSIDRLHSLRIHGSNLVVIGFLVFSLMLLKFYYELAWICLDRLIKIDELRGYVVQGNPLVMKPTLIEKPKENCTAP